MGCADFAWPAKERPIQASCIQDDTIWPGGSLAPAPDIGIVTESGHTLCSITLNRSLQPRDGARVVAAIDVERSVITFIQCSAALDGRPFQS